MTIQRLAVSWQLSDTHGWGIFGLNLVQNLMRNGPIRPLILSEPNLLEVPPDHIDELRPLIAEMRQIMKAIETQDQPVHSAQIAVLHALGVDFQHVEISDLVRGGRNIGFTFFERGNFSAEALDRANAYDRILAGSTWNRDYGRAAGIRDIEFVSQGVDKSLFHPGQASGAYRDRFVIFSGGKLELRKGQDLVIAAFKIFHARHPDALLISSWQNGWPESAMDITASVHVGTSPKVDADENLMITQWAADNGIPANAFIDLGWLPNRTMPAVLRDIDAAVFPNRCEGGTNLVAMEAMACGVPCILSANTGHLDIMTDDNCFALHDQRPVTDQNGDTSMWRESQVEQIVEQLEIIYTDRTAARQRGEAGATFMGQLSWQNQTAALVNAVSDLL